jgi:flavin-dependent dehydrogenase
MICPRRTVLDKLLVDAAAEAGVEVVEGFTVTGITSSDGRITGIRGHKRGGPEIEIQARIVVGADGRHSIVASTVGAEAYHVRPAATCLYYSYWRNLPPHLVAIHARERRVLITTPTNDGMHIAIAVFPVDEFDTVKSDIDRHFMAAMDLVPELAGMLRAGERAERYYGTADTPNFFRKPYGEGWALAGDAGYHKDPCTAQGISDAFRSVEWLSDAIHAGLSGATPFAESLADYHRIRDEHFMPMYEMTFGLAQLMPPPPEIQALYAALLHNQVEADRFFGTLAGTVPIPEFYAPDNIKRIVSGIADSAGA